MHEPEYNLLNCVPFGEKLYEDFVRDRLDLKTISVFSRISSKYAPVDLNNQRVQRKAVKGGRDSQEKLRTTKQPDRSRVCHISRKDSGIHA